MFRLDVSDADDIFVPFNDVKDAFQSLLVFQLRGPLRKMSSEFTNLVDLVGWILPSDQLEDHQLCQQIEQELDGSLHLILPYILLSHFIFGGYFYPICPKIKSKTFKSEEKFEILWGK